MDANEPNSEKVSEIDSTPVASSQTDSTAKDMEGDIPKDNYPLYIIAIGIFLGCACIAGAYTYVQLNQSKKTLEIIVPPNIEEFEEGRSYIDESDVSEETPENIDKDSEKGEIFHHSIKLDSRDYKQYYANLIEQEGVVWQLSPIAHGDLKLFHLNGQMRQWLDKQSFQYWKLADVNGESLFFVLIPCDGMICSRFSLFFVGSESSGYRLIAAHSDLEELNKDYYGLELASSIAIDRDFRLLAYDLPETLTLMGVEFEMRFGSGWVSEKDFFANSVFNELYSRRPDFQYSTEFIVDTPYGPMFRGKRDLWGGITADLDYGIRLPGGLFAGLTHTPDFIWDDRVPRIGWLDGTDNVDSYRTDGLSGCGVGGPEIMNQNIPPEKLLLAGYTIDEKPIYKVIDPEHPIVTRVFDGGDVRNYYEYNDITKKTESFEITKSEFVEAGGVLIYVDEFDFQHVLTHTKYGPQAECAKPVVYLYPEEVTNVFVSLDAVVTVSDPEYESGWSAIAHPSGSLIVKGEVYDSLFWDGYGHGEYPVFEEGFVVETARAIEMMSEHLKTMGFNQKEIADFAEFWTPHMPEEPYTKFSWIGTEGMENLAKLHVTPEPDTMIRAFVDFEGVSQPVSIESQRIKSYERNGFVVTEWGGLLRK